MPKFLRLNDANPSALRPLRVEDLQDIWDAVAAMLSQGVNTPVIVSGFNYLNAILDPNAPITSGVIAYGGKLYAYNADETPLKLGASAYLHDNVPTDDQRQLSDGTIQVFSFKNVVNSTALNGVPVGALTVDKINKMRGAYIAPRSVTGDNIALRTISRANLVRTFAPVVSSGLSKALPQTAYLYDFIQFVDDCWKIDTITFSDGTTLSLSGVSISLDELPYTFSVYVIPDTTSRVLNVQAYVSYLIKQQVSISSGKGAIITFGRTLDGYSVISTVEFSPN